MNQVHHHEVGLVTRAMNAEIDVEHLRMLLTNLTTATCPYINSNDASEALRKAHQEAADALGLSCKRLTASYLSED